MEQILNSPALAEPSLSRAAALLREHADSEEAAPWKIRLRTRDLLGVMNCVQCNLSLPAARQGDGGWVRRRTAGATSSNS